MRCWYAGPRLLEEYEACRQAFGLSDAQLARIASDSFTHSCAPAELKERGHADVALWLQEASGQARVLTTPQGDATLGAW